MNETGESPHGWACPHCGVRLVLRPDQPADASGPCPRCEAWIAPVDRPVQERIPSRRTASHSRGERRNSLIPPDSIIDQRFSEQRETARTARILAWFLVAACACVFVAWMLQKWITRQ